MRVIFIKTGKNVKGGEYLSTQEVVTIPQQKSVYDIKGTPYYINAINKPVKEHNSFGVDILVFVSDLYEIDKEEIIYRYLNGDDKSYDKIISDMKSDIRKHKIGNIDN